MLWHNYPTRTHHSSDLELKNTSREKHENSFKLFWKWKPDIFIIAAEMCAGSAVIMLSVCAHLHAGLPPLVTWNHHPVWQAFTFPSLYASVPWLAHTPLERLQLYKAAAFFSVHLNKASANNRIYIFFCLRLFSASGKQRRSRRRRRSDAKGWLAKSFPQAPSHRNTNICMAGVSFLQCSHVAVDVRVAPVLSATEGLQSSLVLHEQHASCVDVLAQSDLKFTH